MLGTFLTTIGKVAESLPSIVGIRSGTEEPDYTAEAPIDGVELRRYKPRIAAETVVSSSEEAARNEGFRRLAHYIFGGNQRKDSVAMTAPVGQQSTSRSIAMTAPVAQSASDDAGWRIRFYMPKKWSMDDLPAPDDDRVELVPVSAETVAVLRFTGDRGSDAVARRTDQLLDALRANGFEAVGTPTAWFYDPPWTLPFRRRNEIAVPVSGR